MPAIYKQPKKVINFSSDIRFCHKISLRLMFMMRGVVFQFIGDLSIFCAYSLSLSLSLYRYCMRYGIIWRVLKSLCLCWTCKIIRLCFKFRKDELSISMNDQVQYFFRINHKNFFEFDERYVNKVFHNSKCIIVALQSSMKLN